MTTAGQLGLVRDIAVVSISKVFRIPFIYHLRIGRIPTIIQSKSIEWKLFSYVIKRSNVVIVLDSITKKALVEI